MHCWDAVNTVGTNEPLEQAVAVDGVEEFLDEVLPGLSLDLDGAAQTICLRANDTTGQWIVRTREGSVNRIRANDQADATVTATASDLLLLLWGRRSPDHVHVDGNMTALQRFLTRTDF